MNDTSESKEINDRDGDGELVMMNVLTRECNSPPGKQSENDNGERSEKKYDDEKEDDDNNDSNDEVFEVKLVSCEHIYKRCVKSGGNDDRECGTKRFNTVELLIFPMNGDADLHLFGEMG
jgi:hypothetical protein